MSDQTLRGDMSAKKTAVLVNHGSELALARAAPLNHILRRQREPRPRASHRRFLK